MGEGKNEGSRLGFDQRVRLESVGGKVTSDAGLLAFRELDERLQVTCVASKHITDARTALNLRHHLAPLLRQWVCRRL